MLEREVKLSRRGDEPWGFRLIGGADFNMPLTVVKVLPDSPAELCGLRNGDTVARIEAADARSMTHDDAKAAVAAAGDALNLGVTRGLYDLELDDYEPNFDPIDQDDFDQPSHPTEVFQIQDFTETPLDDPGRWTGNPDLNLRRLSELRDLSELRSSTESPFVPPNKPYRPFSTEPTPVPPLEDPIILNPGYHDEFGKVDDGTVGVDDNGDDLLKGFQGLDEILSGKTRFKLPISEQYDPDGTRLKKKEMKTITTVEETTIKEETITQITKEVKVTSIEERLVKEQKDEAMFMEKMKTEIDLDKIEMTASSIVDESIEKAVTVASEIKKEIDLELSAVTSESKTSSTEMVESIVMKSEKKEFSHEINELTAKTEKSSKKNDVSVSREVAKFEEDSKQIMIDERKAFVRQELDETIESGCVRRKSEMYDKEVKADVKLEKKSVDDIETGNVKKKSEIYDKEIKTADVKVEKKYIDDIEIGTVKNRSEMYIKDVKTCDVKVQNKSISDSKIERNTQSLRENLNVENKSVKISKATDSTQKSDENRTKEAKYTTAKLLAEQRAYTIGLQTIPNIRGTVQSTYHYDLLLKTFFIHLTDVMVALSRFILAEPILSQPLETKQEVKKDTEITKETHDRVATETILKEFVIDRKINEKIQLEERHIQEQRSEKVSDSQDLTIDARRQAYLDYVENMNVDEDNLTDKRMLSGAEMSQLTEKKSEELINKMGGVITEFQTKAGLEEEIIMQRERRSRSRSRIEEDVKKETTSVSESMEMKTETMHESKEIKRESKHETRDIKSKDGKSTYIAIVEAHVYTNKNLLEEIAEISETASAEKIETTNIALVANEATITERVALEAQTKQEIAEIKESHEMSKTEEVIIQEKKDIVQEMDTQKSVMKVENKKEVAEVEVVETIPIVELHEDIVQEAVSVEIKNEMNIQEIESAEYIDKIDLVTEKSVGIVQEVQEIKELQDVQISEETKSVEISEHIAAKLEESVEIIQEIQEKQVQDIQITEEVKSVEISEHISVKLEEDISVTKEEVISSVKSEEVLIQEKKDILQEIEMQQSVMELESKVEVTDVQVIEIVQPAVELQEEIVAVKEEAVTVKVVKVEEVIEDVQVAEETIIAKESKISDKSIGVKDEFAHLKVTKEQITEIDENIEIDQEIEVCIKKSVHISESENKYQSYISESSISSEIQESTFIARSTEDAKKQLTLDLSTPIKKSDSQSSVKSTISTPTPSTVPPTPLTDEYVFRLEIPLPKITGPPIPRSPSPEDEDPHIVKKHLVPHIETAIVEEVVYETPLPTPPEDKASPPKFTKPGLKGGDMRYVIYKEEIKEIERKSSLLASAIDETIKSIEEYKEEVGIDSKSENPVVYNGYAQGIDTKIYKDKLDEVNIEKQIVKNTENINKIVENRAKSEEKLNKVKINGIPATVTIEVENNGNLAEVTDSKMDDSVEVAVEGYRPVPFHPEDAPHLQKVEVKIPEPTPTVDPGKAYLAESGDIMGTHQGIVDGLEESVVDREVAKELGKPGMTEQKIAELISGESEMLREAHVMGLTRVLKSHMHREDDDSSVDFKKIKPIVESLNNSEVLKALNEEFMKTKEEKKKDERKWTKFLQKPARPVPKAKFGYQGWTGEEELVEEPYKVKIVKQPKPKVAPDYKPQDFNTGPLPWEERAQNEPPPPPIEPEAPILVPEDTPQFLEALDSLPESEVPDLEETGIQLPPEKTEEESKPEPQVEAELPVEEEVEVPKEVEVPVEEVNSETDMENRVAEQLMKNVEGMVDPNAPLQQQLAQMRAQLAALAQLPGVIQQTLELVTRQLCQITQQESQSHQSVTQSQMAIECSEMIEEANETSETVIEDVTEEIKEEIQETKEETQITEVIENGIETKEEQVKEVKQEARSVEEMEKMKREEAEILVEQRRIEKQKKELMAELQLDQESRQLKQRPTPRVGKPKPVFGPLTPSERPVVLPGGRKWRKPKDAYNDQFIAETLTAQAELIQGKALGKTYESVHLPYDERESNCHLVDFRTLRDCVIKALENVIDIACEGVNFMKYEKPPITLDHLQHSDVYKMIHNMEQTPQKQVELLTPVIAEADYREKCRSVTPCAERIG